MGQRGQGVLGTRMSRSSLLIIELVLVDLHETKF